jgi:hypothetical protein
MELGNVPGLDSSPLALLTRDWMCRTELVDLIGQPPESITALPCSGKLIRGSRDPVFVALLGNAFRWAGQRSQEVRSGCAVRPHKPEVDKVLGCLVNWAKVDLAAFVQECDFVKVLGSALVLAGKG